ncbi:MAG: alpha-L-fucosidase [Candidatus Hydrogenedentes bacterium]|nr:alpha-L-fucosidase [Candidatus Hydrogenedentota bacterium]
MKRKFLVPVILGVFLCILGDGGFGEEMKDFTKESREEKERRMQWWKEARFGMFIHWGLYAVPAGKWGDNTNYGEQIRDEARIPLEEYEKLREQFNPKEFNAREWVVFAKRAGMKYIVITSKHIDGFCLFDSKVTDWDVMSTPFKRDILKELSVACKEEGIKLCFYYAIMDLHHPDYLPRREWEREIRPDTGANFSNYIQYMKAQLKELIQNYGPLGVLWFDAEWENTWTHELGVEFYNYVRSLQPDIIVNNRVDKGRAGMSGFAPAENVGDFGTPEQEIPETGLPGVYWEVCMTMNNHWGYNAEDKNYKSTKELIHLLVDIVSKGGNFLLNVGPMGNGKFPPEAVSGLLQIGEWMKINGESIYGTDPSPFSKPEWGRYTVKRLGNGRVALYLHIFDYKPSLKIKVPITQKPINACLLVDKSQQIEFETDAEGVILKLPYMIEPDPYDTVVRLELEEKFIGTVNWGK